MPTPVPNTQRVRLSPDELDAMMAPGERVHSFQSITGILLGCDMERTKILELARHPLAVVELAGETATGLKHGVCLMHPEHAATFFATR